MAEYLRRTRAGESPRVFEAGGTEDPLRRKEGMMLGLRLSSGVPYFSFEEIRETLPAASAQRLEDAFDAGLLERALDRVRLTRRGVLLSNEVFQALL